MGQKWPFLPFLIILTKIPDHRPLFGPTSRGSGILAKNAKNGHFCPKNGPFLATRPDLASISSSQGLEISNFDTADLRGFAMLLLHMYWNIGRLRRLKSHFLAPGDSDSTIIPAACSIFPLKFTEEIWLSVASLNATKTACRRPEYFRARNGDL